VIGKSRDFHFFTTLPLLEKVASKETERFLVLLFSKGEWRQKKQKKRLMVCYFSKVVVVKYSIILYFDN
jgi:hypothetical protein